MHRKIALMPWHEWCLRVLLSITVEFILYKDVISIKRNRAMVNCGLKYPYSPNYDHLTCQGRYGNIAKVSSKDYMYMLFRFIITCGAMVFVPWYIFTIDENGEESALDQVKDFTALVIIVDIDNLLSGLFDLKYKLREGPSELKKSKLAQRFKRYSYYQNQIQNHHKKKFKLIKCFNSLIEFTKFVAYIFIGIVFVVIFFSIGIN